MPSLNDREGSKKTGFFLACDFMRSGANFAGYLRKTFENAKSK
jgi:hypothetical protein